ncbi:glycosyltransferase family 2 protein [Trichothermofontia sp.]
MENTLFTQATLPFQGANPTQPSVVTVIVNYRSSQLTIECLKSLEVEKQSVLDLLVIVVDNNSGDGSAEQLQQAILANDWQSWVMLIPSKHNGGYAYGNNLAIKAARQLGIQPSYFWLLNPDTRVYPGSVEALVNFMETHPDVGICGSELEEADGSLFAKAFRFPNILSEFDAGLRLGIVSKLLARWLVSQDMRDTAAKVDWLPGASMLVRSRVFEEVGLMDEGYFLYFEETDFCLQTQRANWSCWYVPASKVMHIAGQSTGVTVRDGPSKRLPAYWFESRRRYFLKNHGFFYTALADLGWILGYILWLIRCVLQQKDDLAHEPPHLLWDFIRHSVLLRGPMLPRQTLPDRP